MEEKIRLAVFGQKRLSREGGIEIVVKELCTRMAQNGCDITCYKSQGMKQLMSGGGVILIGTQLIPLLSGLFG